MDDFIEKDGKRLRLGYTTGSCAAAAAKAAACLLLTGKCPESIHLQTPSGRVLDLTILEPRLNGDTAICAVKKDAGDDPDVTDGALITAAVSTTDQSEVMIEGGLGVGRVTKPGLDQPVGAAAINSVPRKMIRENVEEVCRLADYKGGLSVIISVPDGEERAKKTFNPRLGIIGGISILGTSGIVEPMSERALIETIRIELKQRRESGTEYILLTPGNYGMNFLRNEMQISPELPVMTSNFIGETLEICRSLGFKGILLTGHIGKLVKVAGGMLNTHSRYGDCRMEIIAAHAGQFGLPPEQVRAVLDCVTCDEALRILRENNVLEQTMRSIIDKIGLMLRLKVSDETETGAVLFSNVYGNLGMTANGAELLRKIKGERNL